jgi:hypothetical protein
VPAEACRTKTTVMKKVNVILDIILKYEKREVIDFYDSGLLWLVSFE